MIILIASRINMTLPLFQSIKIALCISQVCICVYCMILHKWAATILLFDVSKLIYMWQKLVDPKAFCSTQFKCIVPCYSIIDGQNTLEGGTWLSEISACRMLMGDSSGGLDEFAYATSTWLKCASKTLMEKITREALVCFTLPPFT